MLNIKEAIVVEGRYDRKTLENITSAPIIETAGFGVFSDKEKIALLRALAEKRGVIILTDSDGAGFLIRGKLAGMLPKDKVRHAYIPDVPGKERRKRRGSKEGKLGVEGMRPEVLKEALERAGATPAEAGGERVTKADLYALGLSGAENSAEKRRRLAAKLDLPEKISANALLDIVNALYTREEFMRSAAAFLDAGHGDDGGEQQGGGERA